MGHNIHIKKETAIYAVCLAVLFCLFAWRQFFGFNKNDEIFWEKKQKLNTKVITNVKFICIIA